MLEKDPDFYRKVIGMMQISKHMLKIEVRGDTMYFKLNGTDIGTMNTADFYKSTVKEIWQRLGVSYDNQKIQRF